MKDENVQLYMAIWIFWSRKEEKYFYTEPIITPYLNYDWLSKDKLHLSRAINSFGKNNLTTTKYFDCFDGNKINEEENCVRGIIYVKHAGESNLNEKEYKQGFTDVAPTPPQENQHKDDLPDVIRRPTIQEMAEDGDRRC